MYVRLTVDKYFMPLCFAFQINEKLLVPKEPSSTALSKRKRGAIKKQKRREEKEERKKISLQSKRQT